MMEFAKTMIKEKCKYNLYCLLLLTIDYIARMRFQSRHGGQSGGSGRTISGGIGSGRGGKFMNGHGGPGRGGKLSRGKISGPWTDSMNETNTNGLPDMYSGGSYGSYSQQQPPLAMYPPPVGLEPAAGQFSMPMMYYPVPPPPIPLQPPVPPTTSS